MRYLYLLLAVALSVSSVNAQPISLVIAKGGDTAPGTGGATFGPTGAQSFAVPAVSTSGTVAFFGGLTGAGITTNVNDSGIWVSSLSGPQLIVQKGSSSPGIGGATFSNINTFGAIASDGSVMFRGTVTGGGSTAANNSGYWTGSGGNAPQLVARGGDTAPGTSGATWTNLTASPLLLPDGRIYFSASLVQGGSVTAANDAGAWLGTPGNISLIFREGDAAPGLTGVTVGAPNYAGMNKNGKVAYRNVISGTGVDATNNNVFLAGTPGNYSILMRTGSTPVGIPAGQTVNGFSAVSAVLDNGQVYLGASVTGTGVTTANDGAIWVGTTSANLQMVFRKGDQIPGLAAGLVYAGVGVPRAYANTVVYTSTMAGPGVTTSNDGYVATWSSANGIQVIAREGDAAPGAGGALFGTFVPSPGPLGGGQAPVIGPNDTIAFRAQLTGAGVNSTNDAGIWLNVGGVYTLMARKGDTIDLGIGQGTGIISELSLSDTINGMPVGFSPLSSDGNFTWLATLTDGRTVVLMTAAVPEPAILSLIAFTGLGALWYAAYRSKAATPQPSAEGKAPPVEVPVAQG